MISATSYAGTIFTIFCPKAYKPAHQLSLRGANFARKLQGGAIQLYVAYIVLAVLALLWWAR